MPGGMIFKHKSVYQTKCNLCGKACHEFYKATVGGFAYNFCSLMHITKAQENAKENIRLGLTPNQTNPIVDEPIDDNPENYL